MLIDFLCLCYFRNTNFQEIVDALAFELPKAVARFACASTQSLDIAENVVDLFVVRCNPRDMLSILCEVL